MPTPLATAFVRLRADPSELGKDIAAGIKRAGPAAEGAGKTTGKKIVAGTEAPLREISGAVAKEVKRAGSESAGPAKKAGGAIGEKITDGTKEQLGGLKTVIGGAIAGLGIGEALSGLFERGDIGGKIAAQFGSRRSKQTAAEAGQAAGQIYAANFGDNLDQIGEAIVAINRNIPSIGDEFAANSPEFEKITEQALTLTSIFGQDLPAVTSAAGQLIKTGLARNATEAFDLIAAGSEHGLDKAGDLLDTLNEYPTQFRKLGLTGADALGLIQQGLSGGARDADIVADAIKEFSIRAVDGSTLTAGAFKSLHLPVQQTVAAIAKGGPAARAAFGTVIERLKAVHDPAEKSRLAVALFGTQAEDLGKALFKLDLGTATRGLGDFAGATDRAGQAVSDTAGAKLETFRRGLQDKVVNVLGNQVLPKLAELGAFVQRNSAVLLPLAGGLLAAAAAFKVITLATAAWNLVLEANPVVLIITLLVGLGVALFVLWKKSETFRAIVSGAFNGVKAAAIGVFTWIKSNWPYLLGALTGPFGLAIAWIYKHWDQVVGFFKGLPGRLKTAGAGMWDWIKESFKAAINAIIRWWNNLDFTSPVVHIPGTNLNVGGFTIGVPDIPELRDRGGPGKAGKPYAIGVPELFVPGASGYFTPLDHSPGGGAGRSESAAWDPAKMAAAMEAGAAAGVARALAGAELRLERRATEVIARIVNAGNQSLNGLR